MSAFDITFGQETWLYMRGLDTSVLLECNNEFEIDEELSKIAEWADQTDFMSEETKEVLREILQKRCNLVRSIWQENGQHER